MLQLKNINLISPLTVSVVYYKMTSEAKLHIMMCNGE